MRFVLVALLAAVLSRAGQPALCGAPGLSDRQVIEIVHKERTRQPALPPAFPRYRTAVRRTGCYYIYSEARIPQAPDLSNTFRLNRHGVIVDAQHGIGPSCCLKCPEKVLTETELAEIIRKARAERKGLPPPYPKARIYVERAHCWYYYMEFALPETGTEWQIFAIDPLGELVDSSRHSAR